MGGIGAETHAAAGAGITIAEPFQLLDRPVLRHPAGRWIWRPRSVFIILAPPVRIHDKRFARWRRRRLTLKWL